MQVFLSAHARGGDGATLLRSALAQLGEPPEGATLGFIYATAASVAILPTIIEGLRTHLPAVHWLGSVGEGICTSAQEIYDEPAIALLLTDIPHENFCLLPATEELFAQLPGNVMQWCERHPDCFGLLHAVPTYMATSAYTSEIRYYAPKAVINGGLSSGTGSYRHIDNGALTQDRGINPLSLNRE